MPPAASVAVPDKFAADEATRLGVLEVVAAWSGQSFFRAQAERRATGRIDRRSQLAGRAPAAADEATALTKPGATGNAGAASTGGGKASAPPQMTPVDLLKAFGVSALAVGDIAGVAYLLNRSEQRDR